MRIPAGLGGIPRLLVLGAALAAFLAAPVRANPAQATLYYREGNAAYERGDFAGAAQLYRKAVDEGVADPRLYFNYGNALFRTKDLGPAILYYEKALKLDPADGDIRYNLRFANAQTEDKAPAPEANGLTRALWRLHSGLSLDQGLWFLLALSTAAFLLPGLGMLGGPRARAWAFTTLAVCLLLALPLGASVAYKLYQREYQRHGIALAKSVDILSGPGDNFQILAKIHEGTKFEVLEINGEWASIKLPNGKGGFVRMQQLGLI